jgi:putative transposase
LAKAWGRFFSEIKKNKTAYEPRFKKKNCSRDSFYVANDKFSINGKATRLPKIGVVRMTEELRFEGKVLGATVSRTADKWFIAIQVDVPDAQAKKQRTQHNTEGVDLGIKAAVTLSTGESIAAPKPLKSALRRLQMCGRAVSRKIETAKKTMGFSKKERLPKGTRLILSNNRKKSSLKLARLHARITNLRADFTHKLTTRLCRENQAVVIEDLHVAGMLKNEKLARAISDIGFSAIRRQLQYKSLRYDTQLIVADRWYPSSKLCSVCHWKNESLMLKDRQWSCQQCGALHDRDINAARNLKRLATKTALPEASYLVTDNTGMGIVPILGGKVTPVRYECG